MEKITFNYGSIKDKKIYQKEEFNKKSEELWNVLQKELNNSYNYQMGLLKFGGSITELFNPLREQRCLFCNLIRIQYQTEDVYYLQYLFYSIIASLHILHTFYENLQKVRTYKDFIKQFDKIPDDNNLYIDYDENSNCYRINVTIDAFNIENGLCKIGYARLLASLNIFVDKNDNITGFSCNYIGLH